MSAKIWQRSIALALAASLMATPAMGGGHKHRHGRGGGHAHHGRTHHDDRYDSGRWYPAGYWAPPQQHHHHKKNRVDGGDIALAAAVGLGVVALWTVAQQQADANAQAQVLQAPAGYSGGGWREPQ